MRRCIALLAGFALALGGSSFVVAPVATAQSETPQIGASWDGGDQVFGQWATNPAHVTLTVNGAYVAEMDTAENAFFGFDFSFNLEELAEPFDLLPGQSVEVTDETTTREVTVVDVQVESVDYGTNIVSGHAPTGTNVNVAVQKPDSSWDGVLVMAVDGHWSADLSSIFDIEPGASIVATVSDAEGDFTVDSPSPPEPPGPDYAVMAWYDETDQVMGNWVGPGVPLTLTVNGDAVADTETSPTKEFEFDLGGRDLVPGDALSVSDGTTTRLLTIVDVDLDGVDYGTETVWGHAPADVHVRVGVWSGDTEVAVHDDVVADGGGQWSTDFSAEVDLVEGEHWFHMMVADDDGDSTVNEALRPEPPPSPSIAVFPSFNLADGQAVAVLGQNWIGVPSVAFSQCAPGPPSVGTCATIDDGPVTPDPDGSFYAMVHVHRFLQLAGGTWDTMFGGSTVLAHAAGNPPIAQADIQFAFAVGENLLVDPGHDLVHAAWIGSGVLTLTVDDPDTPGIDFRDRTTIADVGFGYNAEFGFRGTFDMKPGDVVSVTDGTKTREHTVVDVGIDTIDYDTEFVAGHAPPGAYVLVQAFGEGGSPFVMLTADSAGQWSHTFPTDVIQGQQLVLAQVRDADGDATHVDDSVGPWISVSPSTGLVDGQAVTVEGRGWNPGEVKTFGQLRPGSVTPENGEFLDGGPVTVGDDGTFTATVHVHRTLHLASGDWDAIAGGSRLIASDVPNGFPYALADLVFADTGKITVVQRSLPDDAQDFHYLTAGALPDSFDLDDDADPTLPDTRTFTDLQPGRYAFVQQPAGPLGTWDLTDVTSSPEGSVMGALVLVSLDPGDDVTITFTSTKRTPPGPPTITKITPASQKVTVAYSPPASDGHSPITKYRATCTVGLTGFFAEDQSPPFDPITVVGLTNATVYSCVVRASNAFGDGPDSPAVLARAGAPVAPTVAPTDVGALATGVGGQLRVSYTPIADVPPGNGGASISEYRATCTATGQVTRSAKDTVAPFEAITVGSLTPGKTYTCKVQAKNAVALAWGPSSVGASAKVPSAPTVAPTGLKATPTGLSGEALVSYTPIPDTAAATGGSPVTRYRATCTAPTGVSPATVWAEDTVAPFEAITVIGMKDGVTYKCKTQAYNAYGPGPKQTAGATVRVGAPTAPPNVTNVPGANAGEITVTWDAASTPVTPLSYVVTCTAGTSTKTVTVSDVLTTTVTGLNRTLSYRCKVAGKNANGTGPATQALTTTKPK